MSGGGSRVNFPRAGRGILELSRGGATDSTGWIHCEKACRGPGTRNRLENTTANTQLAYAA